MTEAEMLEKIHNDPRFVNARRFGNDIERLEERYRDEDGCPDHVVASALMLTEDELRQRMSGIVEKLRGLMGVED